MKLAILLHGTESEKPALTEIMNKLQTQLNSMGKIEDVEVVYNINQESSIEEKMNWLKEQTVAKKYVFIDATTEIPDNFILLRYNAIKNGWNTEKLINLGVYSK